jgi:glutaconyl-CoA/methylmalonyl-CoA decarboxylase subunit gamma
MRYYVTFPSGEEVPVELTHVPTGEIRVGVGGREVVVHVMAQDGATTLSIDGRIVDLWMEGEPPDVGCVTGPYRFYARVESERSRALSAALGSRAAAGGERVIKSPMPGRILKVLVQEGDTVTAGAPLVVVEAMKMENELVAGREGTVTKVYVKPGDTVDGGSKLIEIQ